MAQWPTQYPIDDARAFLTFPYLRNAKVRLADPIALEPFATASALITPIICRSNRRIAQDCPTATCIEPSVAAPRKQRMLRLDEGLHGNPNEPNS